MSAVDLYSGSGSLTGVNFWNVDKSPLDQLMSNGRLPDLGDFDVLEAVQQWLINVVGPAFQNLTGLIISGPIEFLQSLIELLGEITIDIMSIFNELGTATGLDFANGPAAFLTSLLELLGDLGGQAVEDILKIIGQILSAPAEVLVQGIAGFADWVLDTIFGLVAPDRIPILPIGHLIFDRVNLLTNPQFTDTAIATLLSGSWTLSQENHSGTGQSAVIKADGTEHTLLSIDLIPVHGLSLTNAQQLRVESWVKTKGLVGSPDCVRIGLAKYRKIDGSDTPQYEDLCKPKQFGDTDWKKWQDDWVVDPGVVAVRFQITVTEGATAGEVYFDDLFLGKNGLLQANWVDGLEQLIQDFAEAAWATLNDIENAIESIIKAILGPDVIANLENLTAWVGDLFGLDQLQTFFSDLDIDLANGPVKFAESLFAAIQNLLEDFIKDIPKTLQEIVDHIAGLLNLNFAGPVQFAQSVFDAIVGFIEDLIKDIPKTLQAIVTHIAQLTGMNFTNPAQFAQSVFDAIKTQIETLIKSIAATIASVIAEIERLTGLNIDQGPVPFLQSLVALFTGQPTVQLPAASITGVGGFANIGLGVTDAMTNAGNALGGLTATWTQWQQAFTGRPPDAQGTLTPALTATEISELLATTAANASALAALQATVTNGINNMVASGDDFEDNTDLTVRWTKAETGTGGFSAVKGQAVWTDAGTAGFERFTRRGADASTITEYQKVTRVTGTTVAESTLLTAGPGVDYIYGRVSGNNYIYAAFDGDGRVFLGYSVNGAETQFPHPAITAAKPTAGTTYSLECGDIQSPRKYRLLRNNAPVLTYNDAVNAAAAVTGKGWGWGGRAVPRFTGQSTPSSLHSVTVVDIPPTPTLGTMLVAVRRSTNKVTKAAGDTTLPANTFDDVVRTSADIAFSQTSNIIVIGKEGPYTLSARIDTGTDLTTSEEWELLLYEYVGGVPVVRRRGGQLGGPNTLLQSNAASALDCTFQFYSSGPNHQWAIGFRSTAAESIVGNADGSTTYLTLTRGT